jgi:hypothetical protein
MMALATYTFLPWLRRGLANQLETAAGPGTTRATISVSFAAASETGSSPVPPVTVQLVGPGDVTGIDPRQIIRTEPRAGVSDFEPNYLAALDFYDEDFPWRYTPVAPDLSAHQLVPWILLVVLKDNEFTRRNIPDRPLSSFALTSTAQRSDIFPIAGQEWAFAHVHFNAPLSGQPAAPDLSQLATLLAADPDTGYARLIAPRKLDSNTGYSAFLIPAFEVGRKTGLGEALAAGEDGTARSWEGGAVEFPVFFEWSFRTGIAGDFESLVRALVPRDMDPRVGIRDLNIAEPGFGFAHAQNPPDDVVGLEGALLAPTTVRKPLVDGSDFSPQVAAILNAPEDARADGSSDPLVAPPIYGCWHAFTSRVTAGSSEPGWIDGLNLDPRYRAAAGLGARVVRTNQEKYMRIAWEQIGDIITVNHKIRRAQLVSKAAAAQYAKSFATLLPENILALAAPTFSKVLRSPMTLRALVNASRLPRASLSPAFRKQMRPRGSLAKRLLAPAVRGTAMSALMDGLNDARLSSAPPRPQAGSATLEAANDAITRQDLPVATPAETQRAPPMPFIIAGGLAVVILAFIFLSPVVALLALAATVAVVAVLAARAQPRAQQDSSPPPETPMVSKLLSHEALSPAALATEHAAPTYTFMSSATDTTLPISAASRTRAETVAGDSPAAADMRKALITFGDALATNVPASAPKPALDVHRVYRTTLAALEPNRAIAKRYAPLFRVGNMDAATFVATRYPTRRPRRDTDALQEIMNYPDIKDALYAPLADISSEYFLPNLKYIPNNTISLLKPNQPFIESYLVGLNHEFARELLWREYPTDQRGSYFRQFWDVAGFVDTQTLDPRALAESLKDIVPIHRWQGSSALGTHPNRLNPDAQVVLAIRGDLLKRYPNTFIYAQKAAWGTGIRGNRLVLPDETGEMFANSPQDPRLRFPLYRARIAPDIHFVGFDLSLDEARGDPRLEETAAARTIVGDNLGWIFVLQEAVGEPRFGLDTEAPTEPSPEIWNNLSWTNIDFSAGQSIDIAKPFVGSVAGANPQGVAWGINSADMAYILYQEPVMVAVHGREMLKNLRGAS